MKEKGPVAAAARLEGEEKGGKKRQEGVYSAMVLYTHVVHCTCIQRHDSSNSTPQC